MTRGESERNRRFKKRMKKSDMREIGGNKEREKERAGMASL